MISSIKDDPVEGDILNITCQVSLYDFKSKLKWWWIDMRGVTWPILPSHPLPVNGIFK